MRTKATHPKAVPSQWLSRAGGLKSVRGAEVTLLWRTHFPYLESLLSLSKIFLEPFYWSRRPLPQSLSCHSSQFSSSCLCLKALSICFSSPLLILCRHYPPIPCTSHPAQAFPSWRIQTDTNGEIRGLHSNPIKTVSHPLMIS